ncbi:hypothetical protein C802_01343 [Phocaeicola sartorii]|uniref:Uncharacterized protein n=1 Tax=Phocaeicola sartorii TaxID=671267 RepID=R9I970_9BACT|nr:hypothetical protein C802_01343 [Phocaeicola sartorii]
MQQKYKNNAGEKKIKAFFSFRRHIFINRYILFLLQQMLPVLVVGDALQLVGNNQFHLLLDETKGKTLEDMTRLWKERAR